MSQQRLDLSDLDAVDLQSLRLGAQVMSHKAELAARPRVEIFFKGLQLTVDEELARRKRAPDDKPLVSPSTLPLRVPDPAAEGAVEADRRLAAEYLDLLGANDRLSLSVRQAVRTLREQLGPDY
jgi:hypothetical protein